MKEKANKAIKGLKCCAEFLCGECPYSEHQHIEYKYHYHIYDDFQ